MIRKLNTNEKYTCRMCGKVRSVSHVHTYSVTGAHNHSSICEGKCWITYTRQFIQTTDFQGRAKRMIPNGVKVVMNHMFEVNGVQIPIEVDPTNFGNYERSLRQALEKYQAIQERAEMSLMEEIEDRRRF